MRQTLCKTTVSFLQYGGAMSEVTEAYESGKAVGRCQGAREMEVAIALDNKEASLRIAQHTQAKMPSWGDVTNGITFSTVGERDVAAEVFSRVARHFGCA